MSKMDTDPMSPNENNGAVPPTSCSAPSDSAASIPLDAEAMEEPVFVDMKDVVEVAVDDENIPMEDDDDDDDDNDEDSKQLAEGNVSPDTVVDMSKAKMDSHSGPVYAVAAHYDTAQRTLSILSGGGDDKAFLHRLVACSATASTLPLSHAHKDSVSCVAFNLEYVGDTKTPKLAAVGGYDGSIVLYDYETGAKMKVLEGPTDVEWLCFHPKGGSVLLAGSVADGTVWMYHVSTGKCLQVFVGHESGVTAGSFTPDGRWAVSVSSDASLRVWAPRTGVSKHIFRLGEQGAGLTSLALNGGNDGQLVMSGTEDGMAYVCHVGTKKVVASLRHFEPPSTNDEDKDKESPMSVEAVGFAVANPNWCATGGVDGVLKIWDLQNDGICRQVCRPTLGEHETASGITRLQWHPTLPLVVTSSSDGCVRLWDARNGTLLQNLTGHIDMINDLSVVFVDPQNAGGTAVVVCGSDDHTVRLYEIDVNASLQSASLAPSVGP